MTSATLRPTLADLLERLGDVLPSRVLADPPPGLASEADLIRVNEREDRLCELIDGVLVEKGVGFREAVLAVAIASLIREFAAPRRLGFVAGADAMIRLRIGLVRLPDAAYFAWERLPGLAIPDEPIAGIIPDLAVEVLSRSNTPREMSLKRSEYFAAGVRLVWEVDPETRTVIVYPPDVEPVVLDESQSLDGGEVLQGFDLPLADLFRELDRPA